MQHYSQWFTLSHHSHIWKRSAALRVPMRVSTEHLTRTPLSHVLAAQLYFVPNGHVIWWIGDPSWFESGLRLSGKQLRFLILLQHLVSEATCMSKQNRQRWSDSIFFCFLGLFATASSGSSAALALNRIALMWPVQNDFASIRHQKHVSVICVNILKYFRRNFEAVISW